MSRAATERPGVEAVERALAILGAVGGDEVWLPLREVAARTGLNKATILRIAATLERGGFVRRRGDGAFALGPALWRLGNHYRRSLHLDDAVPPVLERLVAQTGESCAFYVAEGRGRVCLYRRNSPKAARHHVEEGERLPLDRGSGGRVLQAFAGARGPLFDRIRADGLCASSGERDPDVAGVAAPVFGDGGSLVGALVVSGLATRFGGHEVERIKQQLTAAAADLSRELGATPVAVVPAKRRSSR
ncbi:MAG TPA: IclR family transcriptional regulator [Pelomicrobium sp.]|nr:IclR family transcriptional regulator [Pelomicrobium sp.]